MDLKQRSRYLLVDPDRNDKEFDEVIEKKFDAVIDKIEWELNQQDINLTDGFYSSGESDD